MAALGLRACNGGAADNRTTANGLSGVERRCLNPLSINRFDHGMSLTTVLVSTGLLAFTAVCHEFLVALSFVLAFQKKIVTGAVKAPVHSSHPFQPTYFSYP